MYVCAVSIYIGEKCMKLLVHISVLNYPSTAGRKLFKNKLEVDTASWVDLKCFGLWVKFLQSNHFLLWFFDVGAMWKKMQKLSFSKFVETEKNSQKVGMDFL